MGKKNKNLDEPEQYEVWILYAADGWKQVQERGDPVIQSRNRALLLAESKSHGAGVVETMVISRKPVASFNGEAIALKHKVNAVEKKKQEEKADEVHGDRKAEGGVADPGAQHVGEAAPGGSVGEGTTQG